MRILGCLCTYNEASRYLASCLDWNRWFLDDIAVWDDRSTDNTVDIARARGAEVFIRPESAPSFLEHEGAFRSDAWSWMEDQLDAEDGDWVLIFDADEFLASTQESPAACLDHAISYAERRGHDAVTIPIPEVFAYDRTGGPKIRTDGFWHGLSQPRLVKYHQGATFANKPMACGSYPETVKNPSPEHYGLHLLHYGYAEQEDREAKYQRYSTIEHNHNPQHISSILGPPVLVDWPAPHPPVKRGE